MIVTSNVQFIPPFPDAVLINEGAGSNITWTVGKNYRLRIISFSAFASAMFHIDSHTMQVIMNDASYVQSAQAYQLRIAPAQRYDVIISAISRDNRNFPFLVSLDINRDFANDPPQFVAWPHNATGYLVMNPTGAFPQDVVTAWRPVDDSHFLPQDNGAILGPTVTQTVQLDFNFCRDVNNLPR